MMETSPSNLDERADNVTFKSRFSNTFHNLPDVELADQFGDAATSAAKHKALRKEFLRRGLKVATGERYEIVSTSKPSTVFNHEQCRKMIGDAAYDALWETIDTNWVQAKPIKKRGS
jgi:hypothetical protein